MKEMRGLWLYIFSACLLGGCALSLSSEKHEGTKELKRITTSPGASQSSPPCNVVGHDVLASGQRLTTGQCIQTSDGKHTLILQSDGNLVLYGPALNTYLAYNGLGFTAWWSTFTGRIDRELWIDALNFGSINSLGYPDADTKHLASLTESPYGGGSLGNLLVMQPNGDLVLYFNGAPTWHTGTGLFPGAYLSVEAEDLYLFSGCVGGCPGEPLGSRLAIKRYQGELWSSGGGPNWYSNSIAPPQLRILTGWDDCGDGSSYGARIGFGSDGIFRRATGYACDPIHCLDPNGTFQSSEAPYTYNPSTQSFTIHWANGTTELVTFVNPNRITFPPQLVNLGYNMGYIQQQYCNSGGPN